MNGRKQDIQYQTPEQVREYLREALAIVAELDPPADLREACFAKAADLVAAKHVVIEQVAMGMPNMVVPKGL